MASSNIVPSGDNGLVAGANASATDSAQSPEKMTQMKAFAEHLGELAAYKTMSMQSGIPPQGGNVQQGVIPGIPTTGIAPLQTHAYSPVPEEGGGYTNQGQRVSFDKARLINMVGEKVTQALNDKKQRDQVAAQRQYEILMTAQTAMQNQKPGSPEYEHNKKIIENFFDGPEGEKRAKKLEKTLGFDAFDAKAEADKAKDPDYQAMQAAAKNVSKTGASASTGQVVPGGGSPMSEQIPGQGGATPATLGTPGAGGMPTIGAAGRFFGRFPAVTMAPHYVPGPDEVAESWRVANKIAPDGNKKTEYAIALTTLQKDLGVQLLKNTSNKDVETIKARASVLGHQMDNNRAIQIATLEHGDRLVSQSLDAARNTIEANKLNFDISSKLDDKQQERLKNLIGGYSSARDAAEKQLEMSQKKVQMLLEARKAAGKDFGGSDKVFADEIRSAQDEFNSRAATVDSYSKLQNDIVSKIYKIGFPDNGTGKSGADVIKGLEQRNGSDGSGGGSPTNKSSDGSNSGATKSGGSSWLQNVLVPGAAGVIDHLWNGPKDNKPSK